MMSNGKTEPGGQGDTEESGEVADTPERSKPRDWTRKEMEEAEPMPLPEPPDDSERNDNDR